jgi:hypothetical protein
MDKENVVYIHTMEYYAAIKKNEIMVLSNHKNITLSKMNQIQKDKYHVFSLIGRIYIFLKTWK